MDSFICLFSSRRKKSTGIYENNIRLLIEGVGEVVELILRCFYADIKKSSEKMLAIYQVFGTSKIDEGEVEISNHLCIQETNKKEKDMKEYKEREKQLEVYQKKILLFCCLLVLIVVLTTILDFRMVILLFAISSIAYEAIKQILNYYLQGLLSGVQIVVLSIIGGICMIGILELITYTRLF